MSALQHRGGRALRDGLALAVLAGLAAGCGTSKHAAGSTQAVATTPQVSTATTNSQPPNALQGEAASAATGDIPDNQVYVPFTNPRAGYSMKYPEGWAQSGAGRKVVFRDKNNIVRVLVTAGAAPTLASVRQDLLALRTSVPSLRFGSPVAMRISGSIAIKVVYTTESAPNPVTNKRVRLTVDRYYLARAGKNAVVDLATPVGVDNVDAYRLMIQSFRWK